MPDIDIDQIGHRLNNPDFIKRLDELSLEYVNLNQDHDFEEDIIGFGESISNLSDSTIKQRMIVVFNYLDKNDLEFDEDFKKNRLGKGKTSLKETIPNPQQLSKILYHLPPQFKTAILVMVSGGFRPDEALSLNLEDLDLDFIAHYIDPKTNTQVSKPIAKIKILESKSGEPRTTFITTEAKEAVEEWLESYREKYIQTLESNMAYVRIGKKADRDKLFPYSHGALRSAWSTALSKCGLLEYDSNKKIKRKRVTMRLHSLRKFFRTWGGWTNGDLAESLMGHRSGIVAVYYKPDQNLPAMVEGYLASEPNLTINKERLKIPADLRQENAILMSNMELLAERMSEMQAQLNYLQDIKDRIQPNPDDIQTDEYKKILEKLEK